MDFDDFLNISSLLITGDHFKVRYVQKRLFGPKCPYMVIRPQNS